ncbi:hypothetical protein GUJ93_ZPchr0003g16683 [Zizania palustris]|uniref:Syntaxin N-terminal domain-containing protein n=1 Tax=Zizania palustris TaxID=103762 RepID=A0A8J5SI83_ZIZPA|nr:hypothetical protein GUJ93_ZPchr0003g16683 [Zizania palustris]
MVRALRAQINADVVAAINKAKVETLQLESLDRSNAANHSVLGCGLESSTKCTRTFVVAGLRKKFHDSMETFSSLHSRISSEYWETVSRHYYTVMGEQLDEATLDSLTDTGKVANMLDDTKPAPLSSLLLTALYNRDPHHPTWIQWCKVLSDTLSDTR